MIKRYTNYLLTLFDFQNVQRKGGKGLNVSGSISDRPDGESVMGLPKKNYRYYSMHENSIGE